MTRYTTEHRLDDDARSSPLAELAVNVWMLTVCLGPVRRGAAGGAADPALAASRQAPDCEPHLPTGGPMLGLS